MNRDYDVSVIGGGVLGCSVAYNANVAFANSRIAIFDMGLLGRQCSGFSGGLATPAVRSNLLVECSNYSSRWYTDYCKEHADAPFRQIPINYILLNQSYDDFSANVYGNSRESNMRDLPSWLKIGSEHCLRNMNGLWSNVEQLSTHLVRGKSGIDIFECSPIVLYERNNGLWWTYLADGRKYSSTNLILAKGAWLDHHECDTGIDFRTKKVVSYVLDIPATSDHEVIYLYDSEAFFLPIPSLNYWLLSITSLQWDCKPMSEHSVISRNDLALVETLLKKYAPTLRSRLRGARVHVDTYSPDYVPVAVKTAKGSIVTTCGSGSGFRYAPYVAKKAVELIS